MFAGWLAGWLLPSYVHARLWGCGWFVGGACGFLVEGDETGLWMWVGEGVCFDTLVQLWLGLEGGVSIVLPREGG